MLLIESCRIILRMQGSAVMGSVQQPIWVKGSSVFHPKGSAAVVGFPHQARLSVLKPCRCSSQLQASLVTGRPPSPASVPVPDMGGDYRVFESVIYCFRSVFIIA